jgi:hypothetical protein
MALTTYTGGCHCGRVRFQVQESEDLFLVECTCNLCSKRGSLHLIVSNSHFQLTQGEDALSLYTIDTSKDKYYFCRYCGVSSHYIHDINPNGVDVNFSCLDSDTVKTYGVVPYDGTSWVGHGGYPIIPEELS